MNVKDKNKIYRLMKEWAERADQLETYDDDHPGFEDKYKHKAAGYRQALLDCYRSLEILIWPEVSNKVDSPVLEDIPF